MYIMYVDESGDTGLVNSPGRYFMLSGLVVHELRWNDFLDSLINFRRHLRNSKNLKLREEIHASKFINKPKGLVRIKRNDRLDILKQCLTFCAGNNYCNNINIVVDKNGKTTDIFDLAWTALIQRFENTLNNNNFPNPKNPDDKGIIVSDNTDGLKLRKLLRKMRRFNIIPNNRNIYLTGGTRNITINNVVEDPFFKDSSESLIHQMVDVNVYFLKQMYDTSTYIRKKGAKNYFHILDPILCKAATRANPHGIVEI